MVFFSATLCRVKYLYLYLYLYLSPFLGASISSFQCHPIKNP